MDRYIPIAENYGDMTATTILHNHSAVTIWRNKETGFIFYDNGKQLLPDECAVVESRERRIKVNNQIASTEKRIEDAIARKRAKKESS